MKLTRQSGIFSLLVLAFAATPLPAQELPKDYQEVLSYLGRTGDFKAKVLKVNVPRNDLHVTISGHSTPTPFGFGGWVAMTKGDGGTEVLMGDLVLTQEEVNPVMSALLDHGIEVTALHNHFFFEEPRLYFMHVHGHGEAMNLARAIKPELDLKEHGALINARMGLNSWAAFAGDESDAQIAGDIAMRESEVNAVLKALRSHKLNVVAIHHHMLATQPAVIFLHYWGRGNPEELAGGFRAALDVLGK